MRIARSNLFGLSKSLLAGLNKHPELPVTHVSLSTLSALRKNAVDCRVDHIAAIQNARLASRRQAQVKEGAIEYAGLCRDVLVPSLGRSWDSTTWLTAGWTKGTLSIPTAAPALMDLYTGLHKFLETRSDLESAKHQVTAENVKQRLDDLEACV